MTIPDYNGPYRIEPDRAGSGTQPPKGVIPDRAAVWGPISERRPVHAMS
jgi:hypothetical protein